MDNIKVFEKLVKDLSPVTQKELPEKIRGMVNTPIYREYLESILLGAYLELNDEISLAGYKKNDKDEWCTQIKNNHTDKFIIK